MHRYSYFAGFILLGLLLTFSFFSCLSTARGPLLADTYAPATEGETPQPDSESTPKPSAKPTKKPTPEPSKSTPQPMAHSEWTPDPDYEDGSAYETEYEPFYEEEEVFAGIYISTTPPGADLYLDGRWIGNSPLQMEPVYGDYTFTARVEGYYPAAGSVNYRGEYTAFLLDLELIVGFLQINTAAPGVVFTAPGLGTLTNGSALPVGTHTVTLEAFGYAACTKVVEIRENETTILNLELKMAEFAIKDFTLSAAHMNPRSRGIYAGTTITFNVSSFGEGELQVFTPAGEMVWSYQFPAFNQEEQTCVWEGQDRWGQPLPDGPYVLKLVGKSPHKSKQVSQEFTVTLDSSLKPRVRAMWSGISGLIYTALPCALPPGRIQFATQFALTGNTDISAFIFNGGIRYPARKVPGLEFDSAYALWGTTDTLSAFMLSGGFKYHFLRSADFPALNAALTGRAAFQYGSSSDTFTNFTGSTLGIPFSVGIGSFALVLNPEITFSPFQVSYAGAAQPESDAGIWLYGKAGFYWDSDSVLAGVSLSLRSTPLQEGLALDLPLNAAAELYLLSTQAGLYISYVVISGIRGPRDYYIISGLGWGMLF